MVEYLVRIQDRNQWFHRDALRPVDGAIALPSESGLALDLDPEKVAVREVLPSAEGGW